MKLRLSPLTEVGRTSRSAADVPVGPPAGQKVRPTWRYAPDRPQPAPMILGVLVHFPNVKLILSCKDILRVEHRRHHGVVLIVVLMHAVAAHQVDIGAVRF